MTRTHEDLNPFHIARQQFDRALPHLTAIKHGLIDFLKSPIHSVALNFPVEMDDGHVRTFAGYRVLHSRVRGPGKGGVRFHPDVTEDETVTNEHLLEINCDILIPAAMENQIRADNAARLSCKLVCETANGPTTPAADEILRERGIPVLPDILANSGGVCVSYFEWVQNIENEQWDLEVVNDKLFKKMQRAVDAVVDR